MTHTEGMQHDGENNEEKKGPVEMRGSMHRAAEYKDDRAAEMKRLTDEYQSIQVRIAGLEQDLKEGVEKSLRQSNPALEELGVQLQAKLREEIEDFNIEKDNLEEAIRGKGGNPSDYIVVLQ